MSRMPLKNGVACIEETADRAQARQACSQVLQMAGLTKQGFRFSAIYLSKTEPGGDGLLVGLSSHAGPADKGEALDVRSAKGRQGERNEGEVLLP
jgi:hypothetical protein